MVFLVIPAYNEEKTIAQVLRRCQDALNQKKLDFQIIVVDDGSSDRTSFLAKENGALVVKHCLNRGLGAALTTGFETARFLAQNLFLKSGKEADDFYLVTLDADLQHNPEEIFSLLEPLTQKKADVVIGSRFLQNQKNIPFSRRLANQIANFVTWLFFGLKVTDSQSGFRAFSLKAISKIQLRTNTMEVSSEIIREIRLRNLRLVEVPIQAIYTDYSLSKGQNFWKGLETFWKLVILRFFK